jgi:branched-chain amino acid transport system substrate-binding protein
VGLAGCDASGGAGDVEGPVRVYVSLPLTGALAADGRDAADGARLALQQAGGRADDLEVEARFLDGANGRRWHPVAVGANARSAAQDSSAVAYIGELDSQPTRASVPITNDAGLLQVSPADGLTSLTRTPLGRPRAGPDRYYPADGRSFLRLVPADELQAETLLADIRAAGARRMAVLFDGEIQSRELGGVLTALGRRDGPDPVATEEYRGRVEEIPDVVRNLDESRPDVVVYAGIAGPGTGRLLAQIDHTMPGTPVYATAGLLARDPAVPIPAAPSAVYAYGSIRPASELPANGRRLLATVRRREGPAAARPEAVYGYEAMRLVLDAIRAAGADRAKVTREALRIRERRSPLGAYRVRATGEVELPGFALYALRDGRFEFERMVE